MQKFTILLNLGQLAFVGFMLLEKGAPSPGDGDFWVFLLFTAVPVISIITLMLSQSRKGCGKSLFSLYLERRRLEEQKLIKALRS